MSLGLHHLEGFIPDSSSLQTKRHFLYGPARYVFAFISHCNPALLQVYKGKKKEQSSINYVKIFEIGEVSK